MSYPRISYPHVLSELSVNRKDPCEVVRELISNSYDAKATRIEIYPLLQYEGFIFSDNGIGLDEEQEVNGITPYVAFFSIGQSTKTVGSAIGYKCQGSKLCFASRKFTLITRCIGEKDWRTISVDNPKGNLKETYDIQSQKLEEPWNFIKDLFSLPDERTDSILEYLNEEYFADFKKGTMIIIQGVEVEDFSTFYSLDDYSYLENYVRFNTRHGDIRILKPEETGFKKQSQINFQKTPGFSDKTKLLIWEKSYLKEIEPGYPYLKKPDSTLAQAKSPSEVSRLRDGQFYSRNAETFQFEGRTYCVTLAVDGNRRALSNYSYLDRRGKKLSGIRLTDHRGTFVCSQGIKVCSYNEILEDSKLQDYSTLGKDDGQSHYIFMINGSFDLVTNRNSLSDSAIKILKSDLFLDKIKSFLDRVKREDLVFRQLVERLNRESEVYRIEAYLNQLDNLKKGVQDRIRFKVEDVEQLKGKWLISPSNGEEHWVGALYTLFSHLVPPSSPFTQLWVRPRTFSGIGLDSIAIKIEENGLEPDDHIGIEYKFTISPDEEFNHPLIVAEQIICWDMNIPKDGSQIRDAYNYFGNTRLSQELKDIGYEITDIQSRTGQFYAQNVKVISLKKLLSKTFDCKWTNPPPKELEPSPKKRK